MDGQRSREALPRGPAGPSLVWRTGWGSRPAVSSGGLAEVGCGACEARTVLGAGVASLGRETPWPAQREVGVPGARAEVLWGLEPQYSPSRRWEQFTETAPHAGAVFFEGTAASDTFTAAKSSSGVTCNLTLKIQVWGQNKLRFWSDSELTVLCVF